jgi:cell division protein FtsW (lipid II flippase)
MGKFFRRQLTYFLVGFVIAFMIYLFVRFDADAIILGVIIGAAAGVALCIGIALLERRFEKEPAVGERTRS